jgi:zinc/manganese transport system permease protein
MADSPSWDVLADLQLLLRFHFMQNAFIVGTLVAVLAGAVGYFVVLRGQSFAAHMLSQVGFPGAAAAVLDAGNRMESAVVGSILAFSLGLGLLFFRLYAGSAQAVYAFLFGTILGISDRDVAATAVTTVVCLIALAAIARPLVFASVDPDVAEARGVPVRAISIAFLLLAALAVAVTVQIVGTLLIFALLVAPGACAVQLTARPVRGLALTVLLSLLFTWIGLAVAYFTIYPVGFFITTIAFAAYVLIRIAKAMSRANGASHWLDARAV